MPTYMATEDMLVIAKALQAHKKQVLAPNLAVGCQPTRLQRTCWSSQKLFRPTKNRCWPPNLAVGCQPTGLQRTCWSWQKLLRPTKNKC